jgi:hypothetical protein
VGIPDLDEENSRLDPASSDDSHQDDNDGKHQENMDESSQGVGGYKSKQPQDCKDNGDRF